MYSQSVVYEEIKERYFGETTAQKCLTKILKFTKLYHYKGHLSLAWKKLFDHNLIDYFSSSSSNKAQTEVHNGSKLPKTVLPTDTRRVVNNSAQALQVTPPQKHSHLAELKTDSPLGIPRNSGADCDKNAPEGHSKEMNPVRDDISGDISKELCSSELMEQSLADRTTELRSNGWNYRKYVISNSNRRLSETACFLYESRTSPAGSGPG